MSETIILRVRMSCEVCAGAVERALGKMEGVESFDIDLKEQKVTVKGNVQPEEVLQTVSKTGKKASFWDSEAPKAPEAPEDTPVEAESGEAKPAETSQETKPTEVEPETKDVEAVTVA